MSTVDQSPQALHRLWGTLSKPPLRTYSRRGQLSKPTPSHNAPEKRIFRRTKSLHDAENVENTRKVTPSPILAAGNLRRTQSWMVLVQSSRHDSDSEYEREIPSSHRASPESEAETHVEEVVETALEQSDRMSVYEEDSSDDLSDSDGDLMAMLPSCHKPHAPVSGRPKGKPVVHGRRLIFNKIPPTGYKVLKKPATTVTTAHTGVRARIGDGFSSDEAQPTGGSVLGKKRKRAGTIDGIDALELTSSTQKEWDATRRIKPPKSRYISKSILADSFTDSDFSEDGRRPKSFVEPRENHDTTSAPYKAPLSHIFAGVETERDRQGASPQPEIETSENTGNSVTASYISFQDDTVMQDDQSATSLTSHDDNGTGRVGHRDAEEDVVDRIIIPQSS